MNLGALDGIIDATKAQDRLDLLLLDAEPSQICAIVCREGLPGRWACLWVFIDVDAHRFEVCNSLSVGFANRILLIGGLRRSVQMMSLRRSMQVMGDGHVDVTIVPIVEHAWHRVHDLKIGAAFRITFHRWLVPHILTSLFPVTHCYIIHNLCAIFALDKI